MKPLTIIISILLCGCVGWTRAYAFDEWNNEELITQGVSTVLMIIDWGQTLYIMDHPEQFYEKQNFLMSRHPSRGSVNLYFGISLIAKLAFVHILPRDFNLWGWNIKPRRIVQSFYIGVSGYNTTYNHSIGIRVSF